nr:cytochrome P450 [Thermobifida fusca]
MTHPLYPVGNSDTPHDRNAGSSEGCPVSLDDREALHRLAVPVYGELDADLPDVLERLRKQFGRIAPVEVAPGVAAWILLGYDVNRRVLQDSAEFARDPRRWREAREGRATPEKVPGPFWYFRNALASDDPDHSRYRPVIVDALSGITADGTRLAVRRIATELLAPVALTGKADLVADFAFRVPLLVLNRYFGLSAEEGLELVELMRQVWDGGEEAEKARLGLFAYAQSVTARRRENPGSDIVSRMVRHPNALDDEEIAHQLILLISAAHDPLMNLIANTAHTLLTDEEVRYDLAGAHLRVEEVVDTVLWRSPPITLLPGRYPVRDTLLEGAYVQEGDCLIIGYGPAHADPAVAPYIDPLSPSGIRGHLAWGTGPHACPAQRISRQIAVDAVSALLDLLPDVRLAVPPESLERRRSLFAHGLKALPVTFTPVDITPPTEAPWQQSQNPSSSSQENPASKPSSSVKRGRLPEWWSKVWKFGR